MNIFAPLMAQGPEIGEIIGIIIAILVFVVPGIFQALSKMSKQEQPRQRPRPAPQPAGGVEDEIDDFLKSVGKQRRGPAPQRRTPVTVAAAAEEALDVDVIEQRAIGGQVSREVEEHLDSGKFRQRASQLGAEVGQADEQMSQRLQGVFDHKVSRLTDMPGESSAPSAAIEAKQPEDSVRELLPAAAAGLPVLLSSADSIRQAIIVNEILTRPLDRWS